MPIFGIQRFIGKFAVAILTGKSTKNCNGVKLIINPKSYVYLKGTELDFGKEGLNEGFKFNNPNVKDKCGCGESFNV
jgi:iron-sulfur cluster assembly protein